MEPDTKGQIYTLRISSPHEVSNQSKANSSSKFLRFPLHAQTKRAARKCSANHVHETYPDPRSRPPGGTRVDEEIRGGRKQGDGEKTQTIGAGDGD